MLSWVTTYVRSTWVHVLFQDNVISWSLATVCSVENRSQLFPFTPLFRHLLMYDCEASKQRKLFHLLWRFNVFLVFHNKFKISTWALTSKCHKQSFLCFFCILFVYYVVCKERYVFLFDCTMWEGTVFASKRKLLNSVYLIEYWKWNHLIYFLGLSIYFEFWAVWKEEEKESVLMWVLSNVVGRG